MAYICSKEAFNKKFLKDYMALIQCTQLLLDEPQIQRDTSPTRPQDKTLLGNWHATLIEVQRKKCVIFTNDTTHYSFVVPKVTRPHFQHLTSVFMHHLISNLKFEKLDHYCDTIEQEYQDNLQLAKARKFSIVYAMNDVSQMVTTNIAHIDDMTEMDLLTLNQQINLTPLKANDYKTAIECLREKLSAGPQ